MRRIRLWHVLALTLGLASIAHTATPKEATLNVHVQGGIWKSVRLKSLPKGAVVAVEMNTNGVITVSLVNETDHTRAPDFTEPLFSSRVEKKISFSVTMPSTGHYFVVLDNRWRR